MICVDRYNATKDDGVFYRKTATFTFLDNRMGKKSYTENQKITFCLLPKEIFLNKIRTQNLVITSRIETSILRHPAYHVNVLDLFWDTLYIMSMGCIYFETTCTSSMGWIYFETPCTSSMGWIYFETPLYYRRSWKKEYKHKWFIKFNKLK